MTTLQSMLPRVVGYLSAANWQENALLAGRHFDVFALAQGEYNLNYRLRDQHDPGFQLVLRVNIGTQIDRDDQILYEYDTLRLLAPSGVTPRPYLVDDGHDFFERGVLVMEYLPGEPLDYQRDCPAAAALFSRIHQVPVTEGDNHLIRETAPLSLIFDECAGLLQHYFDFDLAEADIRAYLRDVKQWADSARAGEVFYQADPWHCVINTEVNSGNFIANRDRNTLHLVDWEMPRWGDPSQDLCHFCSPLTTLWKTRFRMTSHQKKAFIDTYRHQIEDRHLRDTLWERVRLRDPFVLLRGISWSAMGWVAYQTHFTGVKNADTWETLQRYMQLDFIRSLFDPVLKRG